MSKWVVFVTFDKKRAHARPLPAVRPLYVVTRSKYGFRMSGKPNLSATVKNFECFYRYYGTDGTVSFPLIQKTLYWAVIITIITA